MSLRTAVTVLAIFLGFVVLVAGIVSIVVGHTYGTDVADRLKQENVSLRVFDEDAPPDAIVTNLSEAREAADVLAEHRRNIAPTWSDLLGGERFDATDPQQVTYVTGMVLEGQMNMAALAFGLTTVMTLMGSVLVVIGLALIVVSLAVWLYHVRRGTPAATTV